MNAPGFVRVGVAADTTITVIRESASEARPQGLVIEADHPLRVGDCEADRLVLWAHSSPEQVDVCADEAGELRFWHVWRDGDLVQAWEGESRLVVDDHGEDLGLRGHDGHPGDETDLEVRLVFDRAWTQPDTDHAEP